MTMINNDNNNNNSFNTWHVSGRRRVEWDDSRKYHNKDNDINATDTVDGHV